MMAYNIRGVYRDGYWRSVRKISELKDSYNIIDIMNNNDDGNDFPKEWTSIYNYYVSNDSTSNKYDELYDGYIVYQELVDLIEQYKTSDYIYHKCEKVFNTTLTESSIIDFNCDYIVFDNNTALISRKLTKIPNIHRKIRNNCIFFKLNNINYLLDTLKHTVSRTSSNSSEYFLLDELDARNYQGTIIKHWPKKWSREKFESIVRSLDIVHSIYVYENTRNVTIKSIFGRSSPIIRFSHKLGILKIKISQCSCPIEYNYIAKLSEIILHEYVKIEDDIENTNSNRLSLLRTIDYRLFIENYSRYSNILPEISPYNTKGYDYFDNKLVIEYPLESGNCYTSPDGYFVGLKENNLPNNNEYPYIITCYLTNHLLRHNSITYKYYNNIDIVKNIDTLEDCISARFDIVNSCVDESVKYQELYICIDTKDDHLFYRQYEEQYDINIIIVDKNNKPVIPNVPYPYFYDFNKNRQTVIVSRIKSTNYYIYKIKNSVSEDEIIQEKLSITKRSDYISDNALYQYIDINGKRRAYYIDNKWIESIGAPINVPIKTYYHPLVENNINMIDSVNIALGLQTPAYRQTTRAYILKHISPKTRSYHRKKIVYSSDEDDDF